MGYLDLRGQLLQLLTDAATPVPTPDLARRVVVRCRATHDGSRRCNACGARTRPGWHRAYYSDTVRPELLRMHADGLVHCTGSPGVLHWQLVVDSHDAEVEAWFDHLADMAPS